jgi:hypothetical protein
MIWIKLWKSLIHRQGKDLQMRKLNLKLRVTFTLQVNLANHGYV